MQRLVTETVGGELYHYYPLGQHIVRAPGVCGGRPTFKYTRNEVFFQASLVTSASLATQFTLPAAGQYTISVFRITLVDLAEVEATVFQRKVTPVDLGGIVGLRHCHGQCKIGSRQLCK